ELFVAANPVDFGPQGLAAQGRGRSLQDHPVAVPLDLDLLAFEPERLRQPHGLTAAMREKLRLLVLAHGKSPYLYFVDTELPVVVQGPRRPAAGAADLRWL